MKAISDNIFVEPIEEKEGVIHLPPQFRRKNQTTLMGIVKHAGSDAIIKEGETIVFNKWQDNLVELNGVKMLLIKPYHILAVQ